MTRGTRSGSTTLVARAVVLGGLALVVTAIAAPLAARAQQLRRPVACDDCIANWYYFDHDGSAGTQDWSCAASTYDGHKGSDFSLRGNNAAIDDGYDITAMADETVVSSIDGFFDHCTACGGTGCGTDFGYGYGNHVVIDHGARKTIYAHMRTGSVRVSAGDHVTCGQVIGQIGSSGCTTGAHVHVETRPTGGAAATAYDPFEGACSAGPSAWVEQGPHRGMPGPTCEGGVTPPMDAGTPMLDAGPPPTPDGGAPPTEDAGTSAPPDAGTTPTPTPDGGGPPALGRDGGVGGGPLPLAPGGRIEGGCGCVVARGPTRARFDALACALLVPAIAFARRRRRTSLAVARARPDRARPNRARHSK